MNKFLLSFLFSFFLFSINAQDSNDKKINDLINDGVELYDASDYKAAIKKYKEALDIDNKNLLALAELAMTYHANQNYGKCISACKKAIKYHKKSKDLETVYITYGNTLDLNGNTKKAKKIYKQGIKKFPNSSMLYFNYGITLAKQKKSEEALECFQNSSRLNPNHTSSQYVQSLIASDLRMRVPAILVGWKFLILEPTGERAKIIQEGVSNLMKGSAKKTGEKSISITLNSSILEGKNENDFSMIEMIIELSGASDIGEDAGEKTKQEMFVNKINTICEMLAEKENSKKGFYWKYYAPYFSELYEEGHSETLAYLIQLSTNEKAVQDWMEKNGAKVDDFYNWSDQYKW